MTDHIGVGGEWKVKSNEWVGVGGEWKVIAQEWIGIGGEWKLAFSALTVSATPENATGSASGAAASGTVQSELVTATPSYGSGTYTYLWEHVSTSSGNTPSVNAQSQSVRFSATVSDAVESASVWRVTVTDTVYNVTATDTVNVTLTWSNIS